eukprot:753319-Hanusia_phi.AAC.3
MQVCLLLFPHYLLCCDDSYPAFPFLASSPLKNLVLFHRILLLSSSCFFRRPSLPPLCSSISISSPPPAAHIPHRADMLKVATSLQASVGRRAARNIFSSAKDTNIAIIPRPRAISAYRQVPPPPPPLPLPSPSPSPPPPPPPPSSLAFHHHYHLVFLLFRELLVAKLINTSPLLLVAD